MEDKKVISKWGTDGNLAVIYRLEDVLLFYSVDNDPDFKNGEMVSLERAEKTGPYKALRYHESNIPSDAYMLASFAWT